MSRWAQRNRDRFNNLWLRWYRKNKQRKYGWQKRRREEIKRWYVAFKSTKRCERCGEQTPECLQFHHVDPSTKRFEVSVGVAHGRKVPCILDEIAKCSVLCANCHLKHHWEERQK